MHCYRKTVKILLDKEDDMKFKSYAGMLRK